MIMFISLYTSLRIIYIKLKLSQLLKNALIHRNPVIAHDDPTIQRNIINLFAPLVIINVFYSISLAGLNV